MIRQATHPIIRQATHKPHPVIRQATHPVIRQARHLSSDPGHCDRVCCVLCRLPAAGCRLQVGPGFNRDYWARFEKFIKDTAKASDGVYIVTGPLWLPQPDARGNGKWEMKHPMIGTCVYIGFLGTGLGFGD